MPLKPGDSPAVISENIKEMQAAGHPHNVSVAAALHNADKTGQHHKPRHDGHARGGRVCRSGDGCYKSSIPDEYRK